VLVVRIITGVLAERVERVPRCFCDRDGAEAGDVSVEIGRFGEHQGRSREERQKNDILYRYCCKNLVIALFLGLYYVWIERFFVRFITEDIAHEQSF
jgi:hypothetical protein